MTKKNKILFLGIFIIFLKYIQKKISVKIGLRQSLWVLRKLQVQQVGSILDGDFDLSSISSSKEHSTMKYTKSYSFITDLGLY